MQRRAEKQVFSYNSSLKLLTDFLEIIKCELVSAFYLILGFVDTQGKREMF